MKFYGSILICLFLSFSAVGGQTAAELIIVNSHVRTLDNKNPLVEAIAVSGGKVVAVGSNEDIRKLADKKTKVIDAEGKLMIPGFNDSHVHFMAIGNLFSSINLADVISPEQVVDKLKQYVRFLPKGRWILGGQWDNKDWTPNGLPNRELIDAVTPDNPVFIYHKLPQTALANSKALELAGIDKNSCRMAGVHCDGNGSPTGIISGNALQSIARLVPSDHTRRWAEVAETATNHAASLGVTSVHDMQGDDMTAVYREMERNGKLKTRIYDCFQLEEWAKTGGPPPKNDSEMTRTGCLKSFSNVDEDWTPILEKNVIAADKAGWQLAIHSIGRQPTTLILDILAKVEKQNGKRERRHRIEHAYNASMQDVARYRDLGLIASMQPYLMGIELDYYRPMIDSAAGIAFGSDASMIDMNPLLSIYAAVISGRTYGNLHLTVMPFYRTAMFNRGLNYDLKPITVEEALKFYTRGSAFAEFQEDVKGTISVGKHADLVILSENIFTIDPMKIPDAKVLKTFVGGRMVYETAK